MKKHILFVLGSPPRQGLTGPAIIDRHFKRLSSDYKISIAAPEQSFGANKFPTSWKLIRLPKRRWWWFPYRRSIPILQKVRFWYWKQECKKILLWERPSVILTILHDTYSVFAAYLSKTCQIPLVVILHDQVELLSNSKHENKWFKQNWMFVLNQATKILPVSSSLASAYGIADNSKVRNIFPIPEGNRNTYAQWDEKFKSSPIIAYAGNIYSSQIPCLERIASALVKINGKVLLIVPDNKLEVSELLHNFSNVVYQKPFPNSADVIDYLSNHVSSILVAYPLDMSGMPWAATSFPSKLVEFCHLGLPILIIAPTYTALGKWSLENNWLSYSSNMDEDKLFQTLSNMTEKEHWLEMSKQSNMVAKSTFNPELIQAQFEMEISAAINSNCPN